MTWADAAAEYAEAADRAARAGDMAAFVALITEAAKCLQLARNLQRAAGLRKGP